MDGLGNWCKTDVLKVFGKIRQGNIFIIQWVWERDIFDRGSLWTVLRLYGLGCRLCDLYIVYIYIFTHYIFAHCMKPVLA